MLAIVRFEWNALLRAIYEKFLSVSHYRALQF